MRFPWPPRLPVSRRRHDELAELVCAYNRIASEDLAEYKRRARKAEARVAELEQAIREHRRRTRDDGWQSDTDLCLYAVLDSRGLQKRGDDPVTYQDGSGYMMNWEADGDH